MSFDALAYLSTIDPNIRYTIQRLSGGVINITLRAVKSSVTSSGSEYIRQPSIILKHALPYVAGVGESAPLTLFRQTIEGRALTFFDQTGLLSSLTEDASVCIPRLIHFDEREHVLVLSDLGALPNLSDVFSDLGGFSPGEPQPADLDPFEFIATTSKRPPLASIPANTFSQIGTALGTFFVRLHSQHTLQTILQHHSPSYLANSPIRQTVLAHAIVPVTAQLALFPDLIPPPEASTLGPALISDFNRPLSSVEKSFVIGDCWTGTVLVDIPTNPPRSPLSVGIGIIDWEFAAIGSGPHGDMSQFLAHLELLRMAAEYSSEQGGHALRCIDRLIESLVRAYAGMYHTTTATLEEGVRARVMRSAFLSHGAEIINNAFWKRWVCENASCPAAMDDGREGGGSSGRVGHIGKVERCLLIRKMVERGIWFLRMAGENQVIFTDNMERHIEEEKWRQKEKGRLWLIDLFDSHSDEIIS